MCSVKPSGGRTPAYSLQNHWVFTGKKPLLPSRETKPCPSERNGTDKKKGVLRSTPLSPAIGRQRWWRRGNLEATVAAPVALPSPDGDQPVDEIQRPYHSLIFLPLSHYEFVGLGILGINQMNLK